MPFLAVPLFVIGGVTVTVSTVLLVGMAIISSVQARQQKRRAERAARDAWNASLKDKQVTQRTPIGERDIVLGKVRKAGVLTYVATEGNESEFMWMVITLAGHPCEAIDTVYFNEIPVDIGGDGSVLTAPYAKVKNEATFDYDEAIGNVSPGVYTFTLDNYLDGTAQPFIASSYDFNSVQNPQEMQAFGRDASFASPGNTGANGDFSWYMTGNVCTVTVHTTFDEKDLKVGYVKHTVEIRAWVYKYLGDSSEDFSPILRAAFPGVWTNTHQQRDCCKLLVKFQYDPDVFNQGSPEVNVVMRGAKDVYDPRSGSYSYSENPALHLRYLATLPTYGKQPTSSINDESVKAAANVCDSVVTYTVNGVSQARPLYRSGFSVTHGTNPHEACIELAEAMGGRFIYCQGLITIKAGVYTASVMDITDADLGPGAVSVSASSPREQLVNVMTGTFQNEQENYKILDMPRIEVAEYIAQDGQKLPTDVEYGAVTYSGQAQHVSNIRLRDIRHALTVEATFKMRLYPIEVFDTITWTSETLGFVAQEFEVVKRSWSISGLLRLTLKATAASIYTKDASFSGSDASITTNLPKFWEIPGTGPMTCASGDAHLVEQSDGSLQSRIHVSWVQIANKAVTTGGKIQIAYAAYPIKNIGEWPSVEVDGNATFAYIPNVVDGAYYSIRSRVYNGIAWSTWQDFVWHRVVGKTEPPAKMDEFTISVQPDGTRQFNGRWITTPKPKDLLGYRIRYRQGTGPFNWEDMKAFETEQGYIPLFPFETNQFLAGDYVFACKTVDRSNIESADAIFIIGSLPNPRLGNSLLAVDYQDAGWPGTLTDCVVDAAEGRSFLRARDQAVWAGGSTNIPSSWDAWTRWVWDPVTAFEYVTSIYDFNVSVTVLPVFTYSSNGDVDIEERHSADNITWSAWSFVAGPVQARYIQVRATATLPVGSPSGPGVTPILTLSDLVVFFTGKIQKENGNDINPATLTGVHRIGVGQIRLPTQVEWAFYSRISVVMQGVGGRWTWDIPVGGKDLVNGPQIRFYNNGVLADPPLIDFDIEGIPASA